MEAHQDAAAQIRYQAKSRREPCVGGWEGTGMGVFPGRSGPKPTLWNPPQAGEASALTYTTSGKSCVYSIHPVSNGVCVCLDLTPNNFISAGDDWQLVLD